MASSDSGYRSGSEHHLSEVRILLVGSLQSGKSSAGNTILCQNTFHLKRTAQCLRRQGKVAGRKITVVEAPGWSSDRLVEESTKLLKQEILLSVLQCRPGPHAVLLIVPLKLNFNDLDRQILEGHLNLFGDKVWSHTIVLFMFGDLLGDITIEQYIEYEGKALKCLVEKCGNRYHAFMNNSWNPVQITDLLEKIEKMVDGNRGHHFETNTKFLQELEEKSRIEVQRSVERRMKVSEWREGIRKHMSGIPQLSELRIVLLGCRNSGKSSLGNIILNRHEFDLSRAFQCVKREGTVAKRKLTVVEAPGWWSDRPVKESTKLLQQEIVRSVAMSTPHAVLVVVRGDRIFTEKDREILAGYLMLLGEVWSHTIVLFTIGDSLGKRTIERHIESEGEALQWLVEKCGNRYHVFDNTKKDDNSQVRELLEKIEEMVAENRGCHLELDTKTLQEVEHEISLKNKPKKEQNKSKVLLKDSAGGDTDHLSEVRLVLLGCRTSGKSSTGNTILGIEKFGSRGSAECVKSDGEVAGKMITVVEAPGWQSNKAIMQLLKQEIVLSVSMCPPGPHAVLLVMRLDFKSRKTEISTLKGCMKLLTERVWRHTIVLFTFGDLMGDQTIEQYIECKGKGLQWLIEKCGNRYHVFNNSIKGDISQVTKLLEKIEEMVAANSGCHLEMDTKILQEVKDRKKDEEQRSRMRRMAVLNKSKWIRTYMYGPHLSEVRIVLLGYRNAGKSSAGNTILGNDEFEFNQIGKCVKKQLHVARRMITVVETPGWKRNCKSRKRNSSESLKQEIVLSLSMCPPGPHAVLLVVCLEFMFMERHLKSIVKYMNLLSRNVWSHTIVLFTFGESLGDVTIERHIESEGKALLRLVEKCENRYHVFNNKNRHDKAQVRELLEKIEEMVAENGGCLWEMDTSLSWPRRKKPPVKEDKPKTFLQDPAWCLARADSRPHPVPQGPESDNPLFSPPLYPVHNQGPLQPKAWFEGAVCKPVYKSGKITFVQTPELVENTSKDKDMGDYRILCPHAGQFKCRFTDLVFYVEKKDKVLYRLKSWDSRLLQGLGQKEPAGPLYSIDCCEDSICQLHLPHCETRTDVVKLTVAHVTGGNVEIIRPLNVTDTHVIIDIQGLSLFGIIKSLLFQAYPIRAQVLLFYEKRLSKLHIHLLPQNVPVEEVQKQYERDTYIKTSSKCHLTPGKKYRPHCETIDDYVCQPEDETFDCDYDPNYHPTFEVLLNTEVNKVTLSLWDENDQVVWTPHVVLLTGTERASSRMIAEGADFVDQHRKELIQRVSSVMEIADCLKSKEMISVEMYDKIHAQSVSQEQMRLLYRSFDSGGRTVKAEFYKILQEKQPWIVEDLESGLIRA